MPAVYPPHVVANTFRGNYPHFAKRDAPVWTRWLDQYADRFSGFAYDVALGGRSLPAELTDDSGPQGWQYLTALRIDAVALTETEAWVIEVRPEATVSALGAALTYAMVMERESVFALDIIPVIVCETMQPDVRWACAQLSIRVFTV